MSIIDPYSTHEVTFVTQQRAARANQIYLYDQREYRIDMPETVHMNR